MRINRGSRSTRRLLDPVPLCLPEGPRDLRGDGMRAAAVGNQRLTARTMARPFLETYKQCYLWRKKVLETEARLPIA
jgi:hypothetical protein